MNTSFTFIGWQLPDGGGGGGGGGGGFDDPIGTVAAAVYDCAPLLITTDT